MDDKEQPKRKRGRPRKHPVDVRPDVERLSLRVTQLEDVISVMREQMTHIRRVLKHSR